MMATTDFVPTKGVAEVTDKSSTHTDTDQSTELPAEKALHGDNADTKDTANHDLEKAAINEVSATRDREFEVYWEEPADQDPENPMNWSFARKTTIIALVSFVSFLTPLASSMFAPGVPQVMEDFNTSSNVIATIVVSIYVLGFAFGPLIIAPCSELFGRSPVYHTCNVFFFIFTICNAVSTNMPMLIAFRFLAGFAGVGATTIGSGTIADMIPVDRRGFYMSLWSMGPIFGPIVGPIAGGFLIKATTWRWTFWVISIVAGILTLICPFILKETSASVILRRKAERLRKETGNPAWYPRGGSEETKNQQWSVALIRPMKILLFSPIATLMCVYVAVLYGLMYILFCTFTFVFTDQYGFSTEGAGLSFLGSGIGTLIGIFYSGYLSDRKIKLKIAGNMKPIPEDRLPMYMVLPGSLSIPIGFFIYGWGADKQVHWILPQIGTTIMSFGTITILMSILSYLVDTYGVHAASAIAANTVLRSLLGAMLPLCGLDVYNALGLGWGNSMLGFIALAMAPIPVLFGIFGERLRKKQGLVV